MIFKNKYFLLPFNVSSVYQAGNFFIHQYKCCVKFFSWSILSGQPEKKFLPGSKPTLASPDNVGLFFIVVTGYHTFIYGLLLTVSYA